MIQSSAPASIHPDNANGQHNTRVVLVLADTEALPRQILTVVPERIAMRYRSAESERACIIEADQGNGTAWLAACSSASPSDERIVRPTSRARHGDGLRPVVRHDDGPSRGCRNRSSRTIVDCCSLIDQGTASADRRGACRARPQRPRFRRLRLLTTVTVEGHQRRQAIAAWSGTGAAASAGRFAVGGVVSDLIGWRAVFGSYLPLAVAITWAVPRDGSTNRSVRLNPAASGTFTAAVMP